MINIIVRRIHTSSRVLPPTRAAQKVGNRCHSSPARTVLVRDSSSCGSDLCWAGPSAGLCRLRTNLKAWCKTKANSLGPTEKA